MKKFFVLFFTFFIVGFAFAKDFKVVKVVGKVLDQDGNKIKVGQVLASSMQVNVGVNSTLVLQDGEETYTIKAMRKGVLENLISSTASNKSELTGNTKNRTVADASTKVTKGVSTAASRADDAEEDEDDEWEE